MPKPDANDPFKHPGPSAAERRAFSGIELYINPMDLNPSMLLAANNCVNRGGQLYVRPGFQGMFGGCPPSSSSSSSSGNPSSSSSSSSSAHSSSSSSSSSHGPSSSSSSSSVVSSSSSSSGVSSSSSSSGVSSSSSGVSSSSSSVSSSSSSSGAFSPTSLANLVLWLDASQIPGLVDGNSVSTWNDLSSLAAVYAPDAGISQVAPVYKTAIQNGLPVVRFAATSAGMKTTTLPFTSGNLSIFMVFNPTSQGSGGAWVPFANGVNAGGSGGILPYVLPSTQVNMQFNSVATYPFGNYPGGFSSLEYILSSTTLSAWVNGVSNGTPTTVSPYFAPVTQATLGSAGAGTNNSNLDIAEIIIYNRALSSGERLQVEVYIQAKYAI